MPAATVTVINGPNLNLLGTREPAIYGTETLADVEARCARVARELGLEVDCFQSNHEGAIVDKLHEVRASTVGVVLNAGAYTHTSVAIRDALEYAGLPVFEVHLSNIHRREEFRHRSFVSGVADAVLAGAGPLGYELGVEWLAERIAAR